MSAEELINEAENSTRHNAPHVIRIPAMVTAGYG